MEMSYYSKDETLKLSVFIIKFSIVGYSSISNPKTIPDSLPCSYADHVSISPNTSKENGSGTKGTDVPPYTVGKCLYLVHRVNMLYCICITTLVDKINMHVILLINCFVKCH